MLYTNKVAALWNDPSATADKVIPDVTAVIAQVYSSFKGQLPTD